MAASRPRNCRASRRRVLRPCFLLFFLLLTSACSDARLYGLGGEDPESDRLGVTGRVCTEDPRNAGFPVRVLFLVDTAMGPLFSSYDVEQVRLQAIRDTIALHEGNESFSFAIASFGPSAHKRAPTEGLFTRNPGELENGVAMLAQPEGCVDELCRDYDSAFLQARSIIEGDMASISAGERTRTQYVVVLMSAGAPSPLYCDYTCCDPSSDECSESTCTRSWSCTDTQLREKVLKLRQDVEEAGALSFSLHALFLAASESEDDETSLEETDQLLEQLAFSGAGVFERFDSAEAITLEHLGLLKLSGLLEAKSLLVSNISTLPGRDGPVADSDGDGLSDDSELTLGTDISRSDTDGDGLSDLVETLLSFDPRSAEPIPTVCSSLESSSSRTSVEGASSISSTGNAPGATKREKVSSGASADSNVNGLSPESTPFADTDGDRLNDCEELLLGTEPSLPDTDGDAITDWLELAQGTDYLNADDLQDSDWDGAANGDEIRNHTDPRSSDASSHTATAYRYEVTNEGFVSEASVSSPTYIQGVKVLEAGPDTTGGLGTLHYVPGDPPMLSWQDAQDEAPGPFTEIPAAAVYSLPSASSQSAGLERWLSVQTDPSLFPPNEAEELLLVEMVEKQCLSFTIRNIWLMQTEGDTSSSGRNDIYLYFAEAPADRLTLPGLFRVAHIPVTYYVETGRTPSDALIQVRDGEFASIGK